MWVTGTAPTGWLLCEGGTIGNAASTGTARANADTVGLFTLLWDNFDNAQLAVSGGRGANAAADYAANKTIALPDLRGRVPVGLNAGTFNLNGKTGGEETHVLIEAELAAHTHTGTVAVGQTGGGGSSYIQKLNAYISATTEPVTNSSTGSSTAHNNLQPYFTIRFIIKYV